MAVTLRQVRDRIATQLAAELDAQGWLESRYPPELLGLDSREQRHQVYSVGLPQTTVDELDRQDDSTGTRQAYVRTVLLVRWGWHLQPDGIAAAYADSMEGEAAIIAAVLAVNPNPELSVRLVSASRQIVAGDDHHVLGAVEFAVRHNLRLER